MMTMMMTTMTTMKKKSVWLGFKKNGVVLLKKSYAGEVESNNWAVKPPQV